ncbi:NACHT and WD repeat domain-containing protein [Dactylosporangium salmoneum]|uniref:Orc1-like AAA ATPase domain-containing protein n=1 Tax=Dactylosporangium salmoneum TaxID=53361 RepID=A0ABN3FWD6_9ACTN
MTRTANPSRAEVRSLFISVVSGVGVNILTAETRGWWGPLQPLAKYPYIWVPLSLVAWVAWLLWRGHQRRPTWKGPQSPYPGLAPYSAEFTAVFFGRDREITEVLARLERSGTTASRRFIPLVGPSGTGKTSLVQAGVMPRLPKRWVLRGPFRPAADPFLALAQSIAASDTNVSRISRLLRDEARRGAVGLFLSLVGEGHRPILLIVDQLDELFTLTSEADRRDFLCLLSNALAAQPALHCLATLRPEFNAAAQQLQPALFANPSAIGTLDMWAVRDVIVLPAHAAGITIAPDLVSAMVAEATIGDALPLLGHLLQRLSSEATNGVITAEQYERAGRVAGAIAQHADGLYQALLAVHPQKVVDRVLLQFVGFEGNEPVRRWVLRGSLDEVGLRVLEELRADRLVVEVNDSSASEPTYELAHDALFRQWVTLASLVDRNRQELRQITVWEQRAVAWAAGAVHDDLLRGAALQHAIQVTERLIPSSALAAFIAASCAAESQDLQRRADHAAERAQQLRVQDRDLARAIVDAAVDELAPSQAALLTQWALSATGTHRRLPVGHTTTANSLVWLPGVGRLRTADATGVVCTWAASGQLIEIDQVPSGAVLLSHDGRHALIANGWDEEGHSTLEVWSIDDNKSINRWTAGFGLSSETFSWASNGRFAGQYTSGTVHVDVLKNGGTESVTEIPRKHVLATSWSPSGDLLAVATNETLDIFKITDAAEHHVGVHARWQRPALAWSPAGDKLAITAGDQRTRDQSPIGFRDRRTIRILDVSNGQFTDEWEVDDAEAVTWSPDGTQIAYTRTRGSRDYIELHNFAAGRVRRRCRRRGGKRLAWAPDGDRLAIAGQYGAPEVWNLAVNAVVRVPAGEPQSLSWSPDGDIAAVARYGTPVELVADHPARTVELHDLPRAFGPQPFKVYWSPDGRFIAARNRTHIAVWDSRTAVKIATIGPFPLPGTRRQRQHRSHNDHSIGSLTWSPDSRRLAMTCFDWWEIAPSSVMVWEASEPSLEFALQPEDGIGGPLAWSPDGTRLASTMRKRRGVALWNTFDGTRQHAWSIDDGEIDQLRWCPGSTRLAIAIGDRIEIWDAAHAALVARCAGHPGPLHELCWSSDGSRLASAGGAHAIYFWQADGGAPLGALDLPRRHLLRDLRWSEALTATFDNGTVMTWQVPEPGIAAAVVRTERVLTQEDRRRFDLPVDRCE